MLRRACSAHIAVGRLERLFKSARPGRQWVTRSRQRARLEGDGAAKARPILAAARARVVVRGGGGGAPSGRRRGMRGGFGR